ncbi:hypothetical protein CKJ89_38205, partial [Klebsiella pneumoniae]
ASAIVTNRGGRTCHAATIARELGIPAVVGCGDDRPGLGTDHEKSLGDCHQPRRAYLSRGDYRP